MAPSCSMCERKNDSKSNSWCSGFCLFDAVDSDGNGSIDFAELGAGLSVLCGGDAEQRAGAQHAALDLQLVVGYGEG